MAQNRIQFQISVPVRVQRDKAVGYISHCPPLDVFSQGQTKETAIENLVEALQLFIESCYMRGTLDEVLKDCGFEPDEKSGPSEEKQMVNVPLSLVAHAQAHAT